jgi:enoyl-CoA hydratase
MSYQRILHEQPAAGVHLVSVNRPKALNALDSATLGELASAFAQAIAERDARVLLVTGAGDKSFVAGADIAEMQALDPHGARAFSERAQALLHALESAPIPVIALVNGYALGGGCELALACDWIIASERARFGQPEVKLGVPPGFGGTQRLPRRIPAAMALELLLTGRQIEAGEALRIGLVNEVVPAGELMARGLAVAAQIGAVGPLAVRLAKEAWRRGQRLDLTAGCALETDLFALAFATEDQKEGMRAFLDKRAARFQGR